MGEETLDHFVANGFAGIDQVEVGRRKFFYCGDLCGGDGVDYIICIKVFIDEITDFARKGKEGHGAGATGHGEESSWMVEGSQRGARFHIQDFISHSSIIDSVGTVNVIEKINAG